MTVTKDSIIGDVLDFNRDTAPFFLEMGMHCLGCPASRSWECLLFLIQSKTPRQRLVYTRH